MLINRLEELLFRHLYLPSLLFFQKKSLFSETQKMAQVIFVISASIFALLTLVASNADHSDLLERQKKLNTNLEKQLKTIDEQIKHLDWYFKVGYTHEG